MKANVAELRVGSHYSYDEDEIKLHSSLLATYLQNDTDLYLYTIPLTEEWLVYFGFEKSTGRIFKKNGILIISDVIFEVFLGSVIVKLQYVHQLQNLYFALTDEELELIKK
jgi:hypothetical protein